MRITWRGNLLAVFTLAVIGLPVAVGEMPSAQEASSGATSTKHDGIIKGTVTSANGKRLKMVHVTLVNLATEERTEAQTDKSGHFQFPELFSGKYKLEVKTEKGETASDDVSVSSGETVVRKLVVKRPG